jgi:osmotically inducible protein OsmC
MPTRSAHARWEGTHQECHGKLKLGSGAFHGADSFASRFENGTGTNPAEILGAAHVGCFAMALPQAGFKQEFVDANARLTIERLLAKERSG